MESNSKIIDASTEELSSAGPFLSYDTPSAQTEKNALGFFSLPAELRNKIYELIFEHKDPIFVAQHEHPANIQLVTYRRITDQSDGLAHPRRLRMQTVPGTPCVRVYQLGIPLFLASRKTYEEASSVFYINNTFSVTNNCTRWLEAGSGPCGLHSLMRWLQKLGTRARLLRRLEVDLDIFFSSQKVHNWVPMADELLDLWPLLEFLWRNDLRLDLSVGRCESESESEVEDGAYHTTSRVNSPISIDFNRSALNAAIASLNRDDLRLKVHTRLMAQMAVRLDGSGGVVTFFSAAAGGSHESTKPSLTPYGFQAARERYLDRKKRGYSEYTDGFRRFVVENGRCVWEPNECPTLSSMPPHLRRRIIKYTQSEG